jgi:DNA-binding NtrC family response regulator
MTGMEVLSALLERDRSLPCVFVTAFGSIPSAVAAMRAGAFDFLTKPFDNDLLLLTLERALKLRRLKGRVDTLERDIEGRSAFPEILGSSDAVFQLRSQLLRASRSDVTVIFTGESGTGKGLAARVMHQHSSRGTGPFVPINCAAIPSSLAEAELFGVERGA